MTERKLAFTIYGRPQQRGSKRAFRLSNGRTIMVDANQQSKAWMTCVQDTVGPLWEGKRLFSGPIELSAVFYFRRPKSHYGTGRNADQLKPSAPEDHAQSPDLAKLVRCLEDALTGVVWLDDRFVHSYRHIHREWTTGSERASVEVVW